MFNLPLPPPLPLPAQPNLVTFHSTIPTLAVSLRRPIRNFGCRGRTLPVTQSPIASNGLLEAHPKTFGLRHALPYHVCCDLTLMLSPGHRPSYSLGNPHSQSCSGSLLAVVAVSATSAERPTPPFKTHHSQIIYSPLPPLSRVHRFNTITSDVLLLANLAQVGSRDRQVCRLPAQ